MKTYDLEFKKMIVDFYLKGQSVDSLANEYNIPRQNIYSWIRQYKPLNDDNNGNSITLNEVEKMRKEMKNIKEENEVLKKCIAIFSVKN